MSEKEKAVRVAVNFDLSTKVLEDISGKGNTRKPYADKAQHGTAVELLASKDSVEEREKALAQLQENIGLKDSIIQHEGYSKKVYPCPA